MDKTTILHRLLACSSLLGVFTALISTPFHFQPILSTMTHIGVLSNCLVCALSLSQLFTPNSKFAYWMTNVSVQTSITTYISISAFAFLFLGRNSGLQDVTWLTNMLLHYVTPVLFLIYWFYQVRGKVMHFKRTLWVLVLPMLYLLYSLLYGLLVGYYPYPLTNGFSTYSGAVAMTLSLGLLCWLVSAIYWAISKYMVPLYV